MYRLWIFLVAILALSASVHAEQAKDPLRGVGLYGLVCHNEADTIALIEKCKKAGITILYPSVSGAGGVGWKTEREGYYYEFLPALESGFDPLASLIEHAHAAGILVYPSVAVCPGGRLIAENPQWETYDRRGRKSSETTGTAASLAYPEVRKAKVELIMDLVNNYDVDGVLLDYCRYPENTKTPEQAYGFYGYDKPLIDACLQLYGFDPREEEIDSPNWTVFNTMRAETVAAFVREMREAINESGRNVRLGAFGDVDPDHEARMCGRDYAAWSRRGLVDDVLLATYTETFDQMPGVVQNVRDAIGPDVVLHAALATFNRKLSSDEDIQKATRQLLSGGADTVWVYRQDFLEEMNLWGGVRMASDIVPKN